MKKSELSNTEQHLAEKSLMDAEEWRIKFRNLDYSALSLESLEYIIKDANDVIKLGEDHIKKLGPMPPDVAATDTYIREIRDKCYTELNKRKRYEP